MRISSVTNILFLILFIDHCKRVVSFSSIATRRSVSRKRAQQQQSIRGELPTPATPVASIHMSTSSKDDGSSSSSIDKKRITSRLSSLTTSLKNSLPWTKLALAFAVGYRWGTKNAAKRIATSEIVVATATRQFPWSTILLVAFGIKEIWFVTPQWIKRNLPFYKSKPKTLSQTSSSNSSDSNDLANFAAMSIKLQAMLDVANAKIEQTVNSDNEETDTKKSALSVQMTLFIILQVMNQYGEYLIKRREEVYLADGRAIDFSSAADTESLKGLDRMFEFADWAYDELPEELGTLDEALKREGYRTLVRHDKPGIPGYVSHYVALNAAERTALISVKGTSGLEDFITDVCASSVNYTLPYSQVAVSCHEGILLSSQRLIAELEEIIQEWVIPTGYKVILTGHSLGAGVAALVGILLRDRFASLDVKVWAFASPPIIDHDGALDCQSYVTTIVNNFDIIPRASLSNVVVLLEFLKYVEQKIEDSGQALPNDFVSATQYVYSVLTKKEETGLDAEEIIKGMEQGFEKVKLRDPDHLYVPGRVINMLNKDIASGEGDSSPVETTTTTTAQVLSGTSKALRSIELESSLLTDHLSPAYRSSLRSLMEKL